MTPGPIQSIPAFLDFMKHAIEVFLNVPSTLEVEASDAGDIIVVYVKADPHDLGRIIGKQGRMAEALRVYFQACLNNHLHRKLVINFSRRDER
jgi:predicted RNA-binding protein YlqC (UPF0109 family)